MRCNTVEKTSSQKYYKMDESIRDVDASIIDSETSCPVCNAEFLDSEDLSVHVKQHSQLGESSQTRFCNTCLITFPDIEHYALHIINNHLSSAVSCKYCTRVYYDRNKLKQHERKHKVSSSRLSCSQCHTIFCNKAELELHEYKEHANVEDGIMLQKCFSILSSLLNMSIRRFLVVPYENFLYTCVSCNITTHNVEKYIKHLQIENVKSFTCDDCCRVFSSKYNTLRHMQSRRCCSLKSNSNKQCEKCHKNINKALYMEHVKHCPGDIQSIDYSLQLNENAAMLQTCKFCHRPFVGNDALMKHIERTHKDSLHLYKYLCLSCDVVFKHPKILFSHYFTKHKDLKPYTCKICNEKFRIRKAFSLHIKIHHKSIGYVEFDENYHVFFTEVKSDNPFQPQSRHAEEFTRINGTTAVKKNKIKNANTSDVKSLATRSVNKNRLNNYNNKEDKENKPREKDQIGTETNVNNDTNISDDNEDSIDSRTNFIGQKKDSNDINNSYIMHITESEEQTEVESKRKPPKKRKRKEYEKRKSSRSKFKSSTEIYDSDPSSDDSNMPLFSVKNKVRAKKKKKSKQLKVVQSHIPKKYKFLCGICNKNCYTYQNYYYHLSLHKKYKKKKCIKCNETFKSKFSLSRHMQEKHTTSQLTETLKQLLERRKNNIYIPKDQKAIAEGLRRTIKKIESEEDTVSATCTLVDNKLSVKNFIETFTPDIDSTTKDITVSNSVSIKVIDEVKKSPLIKMTKCNQAPMHDNVKPRMPIKFKVDREPERVKVSIKISHSPAKKSSLRFTHQIEQIDHSYTDPNDVVEHNVQYVEDGQYYDINFDNNIQNDNDNVPDVAEEIMLNTEEEKIQQKVIIPNLPENYSNIRIAHLQSEAPFYKIVKLNEVCKPKKPEKPPPEDNVILPDGTKLVNVNPLAHLMRDMDMEQIFKANRKSYEPKSKDIKRAIVKALEVKNRGLKKKTTKSKRTSKVL